MAVADVPGQHHSCPGADRRSSAERVGVTAGRVAACRWHHSAIFMLTACICPALASASGAGGPDLRDRLIACSSVEDRLERFDCYEKLAQGARDGRDDEEPGSGTDAANPAAPAPVATTRVVPRNGASPAVSGGADETIGGVQFARQSGDPVPRLRADVTSCRKDYYGNYFFHLDNGQVWKSVDSGRSRYGECDFTVTIAREQMGYKMRIDGKWGRIRVRRVE